MMIQDPIVPLLDMAWSRRKMVEFFNRSAVPAVYPGQEVVRVRRIYTAYKAAKSCAILYSLWFGDPERDPPRFATVTFGKHTRLEKIYSRHYGGDSRPPGGPASGAALFLPEYPCLVEFFPTDWNLPSLAWATDPKEVAALLPHRKAGGGGTLLSPLLDVQVVRYRPHRRCVLRYVVESPEGSGPIEVIGKVYPEGSKAAEVWHKLDTLHLQGIAGGLIVPKPLGRRASGLVLMQRVPGTNMGEMLEGATDDQANVATRMAAARLAKFHSLHYENQNVRSIESEFERLRQRVSLIHLVAPVLAEQVDALLRQITPLVLRLPAGALCLIHGDYKPSQLLVDGDQVAVVDLDRAGPGDPAIDVGNYMAVLHREASLKRQDHLRRLSTYFLTEYQARLPGDGIAERARLFQIIALVRLAVRLTPHSYARRGADWRPLLLLEEAAACLAEL